MKLAAWVFALLAVTAQAAPWEFSAPLDITPEQPGVFHQLDSAGRKHIAVSGDTVAVVWEESRGGTSQVTVAFKPLSANVFSLLRVSGGTTASVPVIAPFGDGRFLLGWEQDGDFYVRMAQAPVLGTPVRLARKASQASMAVLDKKIVAVWSEEKVGHPRIRFAYLRFDGQRVSFDAAAQDVDVAPPKAGQLYPDVALTPAGVSVAWEDRREGHTVLLYALSKDGRHFGKPKVLNEQPPKRPAVYGKGTGAARVALARHGQQGVAAAWLDKRNFLEGYDVYAGFSRDGARFGRNEKVQDDFGNNISQWHAALAADSHGRVAVVWDDDRDGTADLWLAWPEGAGQWSESQPVPVASGPGQQSSPAIAFDAAGSLHIVWVERETPDAGDGDRSGPSWPSRGITPSLVGRGRTTSGAVAEETSTRLRYAVGRSLNN
jgi:hypothetical protein